MAATEHVIIGERAVTHALHLQVAHAYEHVRVLRAAAVQVVRVTLDGVVDGVLVLACRVMTTVTPQKVFESAREPQVDMAGGNAQCGRLRCFKEFKLTVPLHRPFKRAMPLQMTDEPWIEH
jgi:hypothetical protein